MVLTAPISAPNATEESSTVYVSLPSGMASLINCRIAFLLVWLGLNVTAAFGMLKSFDASESVT